MLQVQLFDVFKGLETMIDKLIDWKDRTDFTEYYLAITRRRDFVRDEYRSEADTFYIRWPADKKDPEFPYWVEWERDPLGYYIWRFVVYIGRFPECVRETIENEFRRELSYDWNVKSTVEWIPSDSCTPNDKTLAMNLEKARTEESVRWVFCRHDTLKDLEYSDYEAERYFHPVDTQPTTSQPSTANNVVEAVDVAAVDAAVRDRVAADRVVAADTVREADLVVDDPVAPVAVRVFAPDRRQAVDDVAAAGTVRKAGQPSTTAGKNTRKPKTKKQYTKIDPDLTLKVFRALQDGKTQDEIAEEYHFDKSQFRKNKLLKTAKVLAKTERDKTRAARILLTVSGALKEGELEDGKAYIDYENDDSDY